MITCLLFSVAIAFPFMNWRNEPEGILQNHHLINVSIFMLKRGPPPEGLWYYTTDQHPMILLTCILQEDRVPLNADIIASPSVSWWQQITSRTSCEHFAGLRASGTYFRASRINVVPVKTFSQWQNNSAWSFLFSHHWGPLVQCWYNRTAARTRLEWQKLFSCTISLGHLPGNLQRLLIQCT